MLVLQRTLVQKVQIWTEYNVLSALDLVQNMACHASATPAPASHAMLKLLLAYCPTGMAEFRAEN